MKTELLSDDEFRILSQIHSKNNLTQREISKNVGFSLGMVNIIISRLARKGLLKISKITRKTVKYILTPKGFEEKARKSYHYVIDTVKRLNQIRGKLEAIIGNIDFNRYQKVIISDEFEILDIIRLVLKEKGVNNFIITHIDEYKKNNFYIIKDFSQKNNRENILNLLAIM